MIGGKELTAASNEAMHAFLSSDSNYQITSHYTSGRDAWQAAIKWLIEKSNPAERYDPEEAEKHLPRFDPLVYQVLSELDQYHPVFQYGCDAHKRIQEALEEFKSR